MCGIAISFCLKEQLIISCPLLALDGSSLFTKSCQVSLARYIPTPRKIKRSLRLVMECVSTNSHLPCIFGYVWLSSNQDLQPRHVKHPQAAGPTAQDNCKALVAVPAQQHHETELAMLCGAKLSKKCSADIWRVSVPHVLSSWKPVPGLSRFVPLCWFRSLSLAFHYVLYYKYICL